MQITILLLTYAMFLLVVYQDLGRNEIDQHELCGLSKSFNSWADSSFGPGVAEFDGNNLMFILTCPREENPALDRLKSSLSVQRQFHSRAVARPPSFCDEMGSMLELGSYERARLSEKLYRTLALLILGGCFFRYGFRQLKPRPQIADEAEELLLSKCALGMVVLLATGFVLLTVMQLRVCKYHCSQAQATGYSIGSIRYEGRVLTTCTFDGDRWGLPRLTTVFGVDEAQTERIHAKMLFWGGRGGRVFAVSKHFQDQEPSFISSLWTGVTHPTARSLDAACLVYGFLSQLLPILYYQRRLLNCRPAVKSSVGPNRQQKLVMGESRPDPRFVAAQVELFGDGRNPSWGDARVPI